MAPIRMPTRLGMAVPALLTPIRLRAMVVSRGVSALLKVVSKLETVMPAMIWLPGAVEVCPPTRLSAISVPRAPTLYELYSFLALHY
jgi:hypothetical protein